MKDHSPIEDFKKLLSLDKIKSLLVIIPAFLVFLSFIYLFTYYSFFDVNIFNYITLNTIALYAIRVITVAVLATISIIILYTFGFKVIIKKGLRDIKKVDKYTVLANVLRVTFLIIIHISYRLFSHQNIYQIFDLTIYASAYWLTFYIFGFLLVVTITLIKYSLIADENKIWINGINISYTSIILVLLYSFLQVNEVIYNQEYKYIEGQNLIGNYSDEKLKLIGKSDDYFFLQPMDNETIIIKKYDDFKRLHIQTFRDTSKSTD
jgi:hypothetical protein